MVTEASVVEQLLNVKLAGPYDVYHGICILVSDKVHPIGTNNFQGTFNEVKAIILPFVKTWPHYSGCEEYPVPSGNCRSAISVYEHYSYVYDMWKMSEPYGELRWSLLDHLLNQLGSRQP
ncbi:hypothetical protein D3C81_441930 [compost metagenome]